MSIQPKNPPQQKAPLQQKGLGRGLSALMADDYSKMADDYKSDIAHGEHKGDNHGENVALLNLDEITSGQFQPRTKFTDQYLQELADSIRKNGIMQPIIVRPIVSASAKYEIIAGERRWRAAKIAELGQIPAIIRDINDQQALELALIENIQRQDLTPLEEAAGYQRLIDEFSHTQEELAQIVGKSRSHVANLLRLLTLPAVIKNYLENDKISMGHARALLNAPNAVELVEEVIKRGLNVRQTENICRSGNVSNANDAPTSRPARPSTPNVSRYQKDEDIVALEQTLSANLGLAVVINDHNQRGEIVIHYDSLAQLDCILQRLGDAA